MTTPLQPISSFSGEFEFLSNFSPHPIECAGELWPTAEHLFQALKTDVWEEREMIRRQTTPGRAKRAGRKVTLRPEWEEVKIAAMDFIVRQKFHQHPAIARALIATGDRELIEGNTWGDKFWGVCDGEGRNELGRILMTVREEKKRR